LVGLLSRRRHIDRRILREEVDRLERNVEDFNRPLKINVSVYSSHDKGDGSPT
jgi:hypothetical protein